MKTILLASLLFVPTLATPQEFKVVGFGVDVDRSPKNLAHTVADCVNNNYCKKGLEVVAAYVGIPPNAMEVVAIAGKAHRLGQIGNDNETTRFDWEMPDGYQTCRLSVNVNSTVPTGDRGAILDVAVHPKRVHIVTWTPINNLGEGNTWVDADLVMLAVRDDVAARYRANGKCNSVADRVWVYRCRGRNGDAERSPCGSYSD